jgi:tetratricopeptide (TPR) repeat protein
MQQRVEQANRGSRYPLGLRVGLSAGEASKEDDDYFGDPVVEAARLCARASGGQILAAGVVRAMAGRRSEHGFSSLGTLQLKGLPEPVETVEVTWEPLSDLAFQSAIPLPARLARRPQLGFFGRDEERDELVAAYKRAASGDGRHLILIGGEAGMGKTTLAAEAVRDAQEAGACVLFGACDEDLGVPYQPFVQCLSHYVAHASDTVLSSYVRAHGAELTGLVPQLGRRVAEVPPLRSTDAETERYLLFASVVSLLAVISAAQPLVLVLDDLHWADNATLALLRHVVTASEPMRVLIIGTYRDSELSRTHPFNVLLAALHRECAVERVHLAGLNDTDVLALMETAAGYDLGEAGVGLAHAVHRETDGNPFFVVEVLRHLAESGAVYQDQRGFWVGAEHLGDLDLPQSVREVVGGRIARVGEDAERALSVAAVIGREFDVELLARASGSSEDNILDILERATRAALVRETAPRQFAFAHALIQHTLYQDLGATRQARTHRLIGEALEELGAPRSASRVGELAHHWVSATQSVDVGKAVTYSREAGEAALAALAPDDAVRYFSDAVQLHPQMQDPSPTLEVDLLVGLGTAQRQAGVPGSRETLLAAAWRAEELDDMDRLVAAALANHRGFFASLGVVDTDRVKVLQTALRHLSDGDNPDRARLMATLCNELTFGGSFDERRQLADQAKALARRIGDPATMIQVSNLLELPLEVPQTLAERLADRAEASALAHRLGDPVLEYWAASCEAHAALEAGQVDVADRCLALAWALGERLGQSNLLWHSRFRGSCRAQLAGDHEAAERLATEALQVANDSGQPDAFSFFGAQLMGVRWQQGRMGELVPLIAQSAVDNPGVPTFTAALALAYTEDDQHGEALELLDDAAAGRFGSLPLDPIWLTGISCYAEVASELRAVDAAGSLFEMLQPWHGHVIDNGLTIQGPVAHFLGGLATVLGVYDQAESYFAEADRMSKGMKARFFSARTDVAWAKMLLVRGRSGDGGRARQLLAEAHANATRLGYGTVARRAAVAANDR